MKTTTLTPQNIVFIRDNYQTKSRRNMAKELGITVCPINNYMRKEGLSVTKEQSRAFTADAMRGRSSFTKKEDAYLKKNYLLMPVKTIARTINRSYTGISTRLEQLELVIPKELIEQRKQDSYLKKGNIPFTKGKKQLEYMSAEAIEKLKATQFQKGSTPHNQLPLHSEHITTDGYTDVKIKQPSVWKHKHRIVYEKHHSVKLKTTDNIVFVDGNKQNFSPGNLKLFSNKELMSKNTISQYPQALKELILLKNKLLKNIKNDSRNSK